MISRKFAVKRLTEAELVFFGSLPGNHFQASKALKLSTKVFAKQFYPYLQTHPETKKGWFLASLSGFGPGSSRRIDITCKLEKATDGNNWWLSGDLSDQTEPARYAQLKAGDLVFLEFQGKLYPKEVSVFCISQSLAEDALVYQRLNHHLGNREMMKISSDQLVEAIDAAKIADIHPLNELTLEAALLDASLGGLWGQQKLRRRRSGSSLSKEQLQRAREKADDIGQQGEEWVSIYLTHLQAEGRIAGFEWSSAENAVSPYDFRVTLNSGENISIDAKATLSSFDSRIHVSLDELIEMRDSKDRYDIYRVFNMGESSAQLCIAEDVRAFASNTLEVLESLPTGVTADSVSVALSPVPNGLTFGAAILIEQADDISEE